MAAMITLQVMISMITMPLTFMLENGCSRSRQRFSRIRTRPGEDQKFSEESMTLEGLRCRKASANKILNMLKAALNRAFDEGKIARNDAWWWVMPFREVNVAKVRYLTAEECRVLIQACAQTSRRWCGARS